MADNFFRKYDQEKKSGYVFSEFETQFLVDAWGKREVLFDSKSPDYFKKDARMTAVNQLIDELDFPGKKHFMSKIIMYSTELNTKVLSIYLLTAYIVIVVLTFCFKLSLLKTVKQ